MDSGNNTSGSLQSSSGDDQEYDSRADTTPNFLINNNYAGNINSNSSPHDHVGQSLSMFVDPLSNLFVDHNNNQNSNSVLNPETIWSRNLRSKTDFFGGFMAAATSSTTSFTNANNSSRSHQDGGAMQFSNAAATIKEPVTGSAGTSGTTTGGGGPTPTHTHNSNSVVRNPKKRSRASRRAPTTVLTTDATNFRAMVQEFTGIPAPPFTSSLFQRSNLFGSGTRSNLLAPQKPLINIPFNLNSNVNGSTPPSSTNSGNINSNYQQSQLNLLNSISNMQNPFLNFQPNNNNKYTLLAPASKHQTSEIPSSTTGGHLKMGVLAENEFRGGGGGVSSSTQEGFGGDLLRSINGGGKSVNLSSEFHLDKAVPENVARSEGMLESWICSSD